MSKDLKIPPGTEFYSLSKNGDMISTYYRMKLTQFGNGKYQLQYYSCFGEWCKSSKENPENL